MKKIGKVSWDRDPVSLKESRVVLLRERKEKEKKLQKDSYLMLSWKGTSLPNNNISLCHSLLNSTYTINSPPYRYSNIIFGNFFQCVVKYCVYLFVLDLMIFIGFVYEQSTVVKVWISNHLVSKNRLINFPLILVGKIILVYEHFGSRIAFRNLSNSWIKVPLYNKLIYIIFCIYGWGKSKTDTNLLYWWVVLRSDVYCSLCVYLSSFPS